MFLRCFILPFANIFCDVCLDIETLLVLPASPGVVGGLACSVDFDFGDSAHTFLLLAIKISSGIFRVLEWGWDEGKGGRNILAILIVVFCSSPGVVEGVTDFVDLGLFVPVTSKFLGGKISWVYLVGLGDGFVVGFWLVVGVDAGVSFALNFSNSSIKFWLLLLIWLVGGAGGTSSAIFRLPVFIFSFFL